uniref:Uncharacterized protein n=1 Tax=Arundo donax TaxID=35708 RepID=A0A0A9B926_ARUDO
MLYSCFENYYLYALRKKGIERRGASYLGIPFSCTTIIIIIYVVHAYYNWHLLPWC